MQNPSIHLNRPFFTRPTLTVAQALLGKRLVKEEGGNLRLSGIIVEAEAYIGSSDLGCHARAGPTARNASMWGPSGHAYVYFTYGMHWMLNFVTESEGFPAAVLIRTLIPQEGIKKMRSRRGGRTDKSLTDGPAKLCQALGIGRTFDGSDLCQPASPLFIEDGIDVPADSIFAGPRVGLNNVPEPWKSIPWRFMVRPEEISNLEKEVTKS